MPSFNPQDRINNLSYKYNSYMTRIYQNESHVKLGGVEYKVALANLNHSIV